MITIKLLGGAKKSFSTDKLEIDIDSISVSKLIDLLQERIPKNLLEDLRQKHMDLIIQGICSTYVLNLEHAKKVITISFAAQKTGSMLSNKLETDTLMRFACTRQINEAIQKVGMRRRENFIL